MTLPALAVKKREASDSSEIDMGINFDFNHKTSKKTREEVSASLHLARTGPGTTIPYHTIPYQRPVGCMWELPLYSGRSGPSSRGACVYRSLMLNLFE